jgi:DNA invertase Pin-like site-specific DNA recombinase
MKQTYAYVRVSRRTQKQNLDRQLDSMRAQGVAEENIYIDYRSTKLSTRPAYRQLYKRHKKSGTGFNRPMFKQMYSRLKTGDLVLIKSIDRLGRNFEVITLLWKSITKKKSADIKVLDMPLLDITKN